jgi:NAD(P)-dependent dehydrogenase (short-subunit alcohol dehydrogenase family)
MAKPLMLITGGSQGIGAATAVLAAQRGYDICFTYLNQKVAAQEIAKKIAALDARALCVQADVSKEADVLNVFAQIDREFGRLDALVNNAGILRQKLFRDTEVKELEQLFAINVIGSFICAREAIKRMSLANGGEGGAIVNVSSIAARMGAPFEYIDYAASKGAIDSFTIGLAKEVASEGIRVNAVRPGIIQTDIHAKGGEPGRVERMSPMVPLKRAGTAEEVANSILWLLSDEASYLTGHLLDIGGGR